MLFRTCALAGVWLVTTAVFAATPLRVAFVEPGAAAGLSTALAEQFGFSTRVVRTGSAANAGESLGALREADAAVFVGGPGAALSEADVTALRVFLESGAGIVVLAADAKAWPRAIPLAPLLGAVPAGAFAGGVPLAVINLFPHPVFTGVARLETQQPVVKFDQLADDAQLVAEGTVGETTTPLVWLRRHGGGRLGHVALASAALSADPNYQQLVANVVRWTCGQPVPNAQPGVQRTFMPDAFPGAFAITLPGGPSLCFDPVRGGINYAWDGEFVDLRPRWLTKQGEPARLFGDVFYREKQEQPWRSGAPDARPDFEFRGYTIEQGAPVFHYDVGGRAVHESFERAPGGGLRRRVRVGPGKAPLWLQLEPQENAEVSVRGLARDGHVLSFSEAAGGEFTIEIRRKALSPP